MRYAYTILFLMLYMTICVSCKKHDDELAAEQATEKTAPAPGEEESEGKEDGEDTGDDTPPPTGNDNPDNDLVEGEPNEQTGDSTSNPTTTPSDSIDNQGQTEQPEETQGSEETQSEEIQQPEETQGSEETQSEEIQQPEEPQQPEESQESEEPLQPKGPVVNTEFYMSLECEPGLSAQGSACYGDYFFQAYANNACISIYNLKEKRKIGTFNIPSPAPNRKIHCNTICFGYQRVDNSDYFPLLYICSGYQIAGTARIYAYRIKGSGTDFSLELVQTIKLEGFDSWTEGLVDNEREILWIRHNGGNQTFAMPDISESEVTIRLDEQLSNERFTKTTDANYTIGAWQGHLLCNNRISYVAGIPSKGENLCFVSINTNTNELDRIIDLRKEAGLVNKEKSWDNAYEPEGLIFYEGKYMISYINFIYIIETGLE